MNPPVLLNLNVILLSLASLRLPEGTCPKNFKDAGDDVCFLNFVKGAGFCDTHQICEEEGIKHGLRLFVPGIHVGKMMQTFPAQQCTYTGFSGLLNRSTGDLRAGWNVGDPGYSKFATDLGDKTIPWGMGEPNSLVQAVTVVMAGRLTDDVELHYTSSNVVCELSLRSSVGNVEPFRQNWPYKLDSLHMLPGRSTSCFDTTIVASLFHCAMK